MPSSTKRLGAPRRAQPEGELQKSIVRYTLEKHPAWPLIASLNGVFLGPDRKKNAQQMAAMRAKGVASGYPDLFLHLRGGRGEIGLAIELKAGSNTLTPAQCAWRDKLTHHGCAYQVVRSLAEYTTALDHYTSGTSLSPVVLSDDDE